ncbi:hypothetical protein CO613_01455 [Lysobacteraceae bacterium NML07-0707]|nr:hypothetical protein CO613_01455 [Xanthomonadaceae bacterium NML07-0707]
MKRVLSDNGSAFSFKVFRAACTQHGIVQKLTRTYRPQTNGKADVMTHHFLHRSGC